MRCVPELCGLNALKTNAQEPKVDFTLFNGIAIIGYVDDGGFLNFTGPNVTLSSNESKFILGLLPSLRFKEDTKTPKNSFITPHLGFGLTYNYKLIAIQIPMYYNAKTATTNGKWNVIRLHEALVAIDELWDNVFQYNQKVDSLKN